MITKPNLIKALIKEYDKVVEHLSRYVDECDYQEDSQLHWREGRLDALKECVIGRSEENTISIKDINAEISKELNNE
tara:strand:+ start:127 stop:357 length:231 start_codon:yes stop_codon:yes gene_type:complete